MKFFYFYTQLSVVLRLSERKELGITFKKGDRIISKNIGNFTFL